MPPAILHIGGGVADTIDWDEYDLSTLPFQEFMRVLKPDRHMYIFSRWDVMDKLPKPQRLLIWDKMDCGMGDLQDWGIGYEVILMYKKGRRQINPPRVSDVISCFKVANFHTQNNTSKKMVHPTQKPVALLRVLVDKSSQVGELVLDPFMGSGSTIIAAIRSKRAFCGVEIKPTYFKIAEEGIQDALNQRGL